MQRKMLILPFIILLSSCSSNEVGQGKNDDNGSVYLAKIEDIRHSEQPYVYIFGGIYDGAAWNQETHLIVTNDDILTCVFADANMDGENNAPYYYSHWERNKIPGFYEKAISIVQTPTNHGYATKQTDNFIYERNLENGSKVWTSIGWENGNIDVLDSFFKDHPNPCWAWG